jgi:hypothetical protein
MNAIVNQVSALAKGADATTRKAIISTLRELSITIEEPDDTLARLWGGVCPISLYRIETEYD